MPCHHLYLRRLPNGLYVAYALSRAAASCGVTTWPLRISRSSIVASPARRELARRGGPNALGTALLRGSERIRSRAEFRAEAQDRSCAAFHVLRASASQT